MPKVAKTDFGSIPHSRFILPDLADPKYRFVTARAEKMWPSLGQKIVFSFLRSCSESREFMFLKTDHAAGLAHYVRPIIGGGLVIKEIFVIVNDPDNGKALIEGGALYAQFRVWGRSMGAACIDLADISDVPAYIISDAVGVLGKREQAFVKI